MKYNHLNDGHTCTGMKELAHMVRRPCASAVMTALLLGFALIACGGGAVPTSAPTIPPATSASTLAATAVPATTAPTQSAATTAPTADLSQPSGGGAGSGNVRAAQEYKTLNTGTNGNVRLAFSPDGKTLASMTTTFGGTLILWHVASGEQVNKYDNGFFSVSFSPDGKVLAIGGNDTTATIFDVAKWEPLRKLEGAEDNVLGTAFSPDGQIVVGGDLKYILHLWDAATGKEIRQLGDPGDTPSTSIAFSPDGKTVASAGQLLTAQTHNVETGKKLAESDQFSFNWITYSPDGKNLAGAAVNGKVYVWDANFGNAREFDLETGESVYGVAFSPDGQLVAAAGKNSDAGDKKTVRVWNIANGQDAVMLDSTKEAYSVAFSPDGKFLAAGYNDGTIIVWQIAQ